MGLAYPRGCPVGVACYHRPSGHLLPRVALVARRRLAEAEHSFRRLSSVGPDEAKAAVALMVETTELERSLAEGESYADYFKGDHLWRTEITYVA